MLTCFCSVARPPLGEWVRVSFSDDEGEEGWFGDASPAR